LKLRSAGRRHHAASKRKFVLLTAEEYDRLVRAADARRAFHADDVPDDVATMMLQALTNDDDES
jgi:hypothetical protein